jgi:hypothetical protein
MPKAGNPLTSDEFDMMMEAVQDRHKNFPDEPPVVILWTVFSNIGDRFSPVVCMEEEWSGLKQDIPKTSAGEDPKCPNGHPIRQGPRLSLGWVEDKEIQTRHGI